MKCPSCALWQFLSWNTEVPEKMSVDMERGIYACKGCHAEITDQARATGQWVAKKPGKAISGYWVPLLIASWVSAADIIAKFRHKDTTPELFYS